MRALTTLLSLLLLAGFATTAAAQDDIEIMDRGRRGFAVSAFGANGSSPEDAGQLAVEAGCEETLRRGFTHMLVTTYETSVRSTSARTREASSEPIYDGRNGIVVGRRQQNAESQTLTWGGALLAVTIMGEDTALNPDGTVAMNIMQLIDARSCEVIY